MSEWDAFDRELADAVTDLPPPDATLEAVTPWREAMDRIVLGLCLTSFTLSFLYLQYLLPALGAVQMYLGFRSLRKNNRWFRLCWIVIGCNAILLYCGFLLNATPFSNVLGPFRSGLGVVFHLLLFVFFRQALGRAAADLGRTSAGDPMLWALVWYGVMAAFALFWPAPGLLPFLVLLIAFIRIVRALLRVSKTLDGWGYGVRAAPVKISAQRLNRLYCVSLAALILALSLTSSHIPVRGAPLEQTSDSAEIASIRRTAADLGFPEALLESLPGEEVEKLAGAMACHAVSQEPDSPDDANAHLETVFVQIGPSTLRIYQFFSPEGGLLRSQAEIQREGGVSDLTAGISWTSGGERRWASLPVSGREWIDYFGDRRQAWRAAFSYPLFSQQRRGWIASTSFYNARPDGALLDCMAHTSYKTQRLRDLFPYEAEFVGRQSGMRASLRTSHEGFLFPKP